MLVALIWSLVSGAATPPPVALEVVGTPELAFADVVSSDKSEVRIAFSPDGKRILWGSMDRPGGPGSYDIWEVVREGTGWSKPRAVPFDSAAKDFDPAFAPDGSAVYFFSNREGGLGGDDLYVVPFDAKTGQYGVVRNLGPAVNSVGDEWGPVVSPDGEQLVFATNGRGGKGQHDLFMSHRQGKDWATAESLGADLNSPGEEVDPAFLHDGKTLVFSTERPGSEDGDLFVSALEPAVGKQPAHYGKPQWLGDQVNASAAWDYGAAINPSEPGVLYFTSRREDQKRGLKDVYRVRYRLRAAK